MTKLIQLDGILEVTEKQKSLEEIIFVTKSETLANTGLGILHRDIFNIFKVVPKQGGKYDIYRYDRYNDGTFKGFSYLDLSNTGMVGADRFVFSQIAESVTAVSHQLSLLAGVELGTPLTLTKVKRISFVVKELYTLLDDHVYGIIVDASTED